MRSDFAIFIMSYRRANNIVTLNLLERSNYTGKIYIIVGDDDPTLDEYKELYGDKIIVFNKEEIKNRIDTYDNFNNYVSIVYARNACFDIAEKLGLNYFLQFEDDYCSLEYRYPEDGKLKTKPIVDFDRVCEEYIDFLENSPLMSVAFAQNGDFIGGAQNSFITNGAKRKIMNSWFCSTKKRFDFNGTLNDDVNTYVGMGKTGALFLSTKHVSLRQGVTQKNSGGITESYLAYGTYVKSFYTVIANPSCAYVYPLKDKHIRLHHRINWNHAVPKIISEIYKK